VGAGAGAEQLMAELSDRGMHAELADGQVEVTVHDDDQLDIVRDVVADLKLPLYRLGSSLISLDEVFLQQRASRP
ncbi:MAG: hypothetical protein M3144_09585, partial [Actinomycetota bacterium]|nr:hypothetical protein [Actinomycetota bacterium]